MCRVPSELSVVQKVIANLGIIPLSSQCRRHRWSIMSVTVMMEGKCALYHLLEIHLAFSRRLLRMIWLGRHDCRLTV